MNIRSAAFWTLDFLTGSPLRNELHDVQHLNSRSANATRRRLDLLEGQLEFAISNVPYYRRFRDASSLNDFPVVDKDAIRAENAGTIAEGVATDGLHVASTSGSTGTPFRIFHTKEKRRRVNAESIYFGNLAGYRVGNTLWHLKIWSSRNAYSRLGAVIKNLRPVDVSSFDEKGAEVLLEKIRERNGKNSVIAYSSSLETLARTLQAKEPDGLGVSKISSIVGQSEPLSQEAREILRRTLGIYPVARYGMEETGVLAQQDASSDQSYRLNLASHVVEVLKTESDESAAEGEIGRVVVTDLFNKAQPLIRYDTGDLAVVGRFESETGFVETLSRLDGRGRDRIYDVDDKPLAPMIAYSFWWKFSEIIQYQIVQRGRGDYLLRLDVTGSFGREAELVAEFRRQVGSDAHIDVEYDSSDYRHSSGKRKAVVSDYDPSAAVDDESSPA